MISLPNDIHRKTDRISINQFIKKNRAEIHGREEGKNFEEKVFPSMENPCHEFHQSLDGKASRQKEPRKDAATLRSDVGMLEERGRGRGGMEGEGRLVGGAPINMAAGEGVAEGSFEGVVDGERGTSTAILSHLCDLELFPPPQEKAARALLSSSSPPSCSAGDRMHRVMHLLRNISLHESWTSWRNRGDLSIASLFDFSRTQRESTCLFGDGKLIELGCLAD